MQFHSMNQMEKGRVARALSVLLAAGILFSGCSSKGEVEASPTVTVQVDAETALVTARNAYADAQVRYRTLLANLQTFTGSF